ncbi:MAG: chromosomal replication initiator protein DnaA [Pseudoramibacter sp.]
MENSLNEIWEKALNTIQEELPPVSFTTWFPNLKPVTLKGHYFYLLANESFSKSILETRYQTLTDTALSYIMKDDKIHARFILNEDEIEAEENAAKPDEEVPEKAAPEPAKSNGTGINPKYTFDRFVIGENNRFAHAACVAVAEAPSEHYNPLFIYGGVGLGKTHLMQAIGNYILKYTPEKKVVYVSCETFTNEFIDAIQNKSNTSFRSRYRNVDILLIDDIQFLSGKEGTQEEFFHTFNALHDEDKQIVISSDRPPKEIPKLAERLRSRFEMGLITDISAPNFETRMAILRKKAESYHEEIPDDVMSFIANNIHSNIRELEGALTTVVAYSKLHGEKISLDFAKEALADLFVSKQHEINADYIKEITAKYFNTTVEDMNSKRRTKAITTPRQVAMYLCREMTTMSLPAIGEAFGGRDHSTVIHGCQKISENIQKNTDFKNLVLRIKSEIEGK